jgi:hypothetical protein
LKKAAVPVKARGQEHPVSGSLAIMLPLGFDEKTDSANVVTGASA